jgi:glycosyltransferase involved in cell wall biosynthesis
MPVYNGGLHLESAIKTILAQTHNDFELIIINDGSTDETLSIINKFQSIDKRIKLINQENNGIVCSLNTGLMATDSEYVARMDADDLARPTRFQEQFSVMQRDKKIVVCGTAIRYFGALKKSIYFPEKDSDCKSLLLFKSCFAHPSVFIRRSALNDKGTLYNANYKHVEDYKLWSELSQTGVFYNIPKVLLDYRLHPTQISTAQMPAQRQAHITVSRENLRRIGISVTLQEIEDLLWPNPRNMNPINYISNSIDMINMIGRKDHNKTPHLKLFSKVLAKNLFLKSKDLLKRA